jgi:hypothetical protein
MSASVVPFLYSEPYTKILSVERPVKSIAPTNKSS